MAFEKKNQDKWGDFGLKFLAERCHAVQKDLYICSVNYQKVSNMRVKYDKVEGLGNIGLDSKTIIPNRNIYSKCESYVQLEEEKQISLRSWEVFGTDVYFLCSYLMFVLTHHKHSIQDTKVDANINGVILNKIKYTGDTAVIQNHCKKKRKSYKI